MARMDQQMIATNVSNNKYKSNSERELHRYELVEFIIRLGLTKYKDSKKVEKLMEASELIFRDDVIPNNQAVDGLNFRMEHMYNLKVDEIFRRNQPVIDKLFNHHTTPNKKFITLEECATLVKTAGFDILDVFSRSVSGAALSSAGSPEGMSAERRSSLVTAGSTEIGETSGMSFVLGDVTAGFGWRIQSVIPKNFAIR